MLEFLREPLNDLVYFSTQRSLTWGIPLPFDDDYVTYVWFDALVNYMLLRQDTEMKILQDLWPADLHVIGKDILAPPHAIYWPIMLKASNLPLPSKSLPMDGG